MDLSKNIFNTVTLLVCFVWTESDGSDPIWPCCLSPAPQTNSTDTQHAQSWGTPWGHAPVHATDQCGVSRTVSQRTLPKTPAASPGPAATADTATPTTGAPRHGAILAGWRQRGSLGTTVNTASSAADARTVPHNNGIKRCPESPQRQPLTPKLSALALPTVIAVLCFLQSKLLSLNVIIPPMEPARVVLS